MAKKFLTAIDLAQNELQNARVQNLASPPGSPSKGLLYFNSTGGDNTLYWWDGTAWVPAKSLPVNNATTSTTLAVGGSPVAGVANDLARGDHVHGLPNWGASVAVTTFGAAKADGVGSTFARNDHTHGSPTHDAAAHSAIPLSALAVPTADINFNSRKITNLGTPTATTDGATKDYVDNLVAGLSWKDAVRVASVSNHTRSGLTAIDGVTPVVNDRVLLKNQTNPQENGIWLAQSGAWTGFRALDANTDQEMAGMAVFVMEGGQADTAWVCTANLPITPDVTALPFVQFSGGGTFIAGNGLTLTGSTFAVVPLNASIVVNADDVSVGYAGTGTTFGSAVTAARSDHHHDTTYTKKYSIGTIGGATSQVITHNLNTQAVIVNVYRTLTPWDTVECDIERTTVNTVTLRFAIAPATNEYSAVVIG